MGDGRPPAPISSLWPPELSEPEVTDVSRLTSGSLIAWSIRLLALLALGAMLSASLASEDQVVDLLAILSGAAAGFLIAAYSWRHDVELERAYSSHLEAMSRRLRSLAYRDSLTGLYNHRYFREQLSNELERAQRYDGPVSVLLLDVDHFKEVNDTYGHLMGDTLLSYVAHLIAGSVRSSDVAARYGGDEFAVILPETNLQAAMITADKLADIVSAARHWQGALLEGLGVSLSVGAAAYPEDGRTADELLVAADAALYESKSKVKKQRPFGRRERNFARSVPVM